MAMSEFSTEAVNYSSLCTCAVQNWPKQPRTNSAKSGGRLLQCICNCQIL